MAVEACPASKFYHLHVGAQILTCDLQLLLIGRFVGNGLFCVFLRNLVPEFECLIHIDLIICEQFANGHEVYIGLAPFGFNIFRVPATRAPGE